MVSQEDIKSSVLTMENLYFEFVNFQGTGISAPEQGVSKVGYKEEHIISNDLLNIGLYCRVETENIFQMELCLKGIFKASSEEMANKLLPNAIAIMFPYLRAQVSILTSLPNIPTISLEPININAFLEKQNNPTD